MTWVRSLALLSGLRIRRCVSCGVGSRHGSDPALLWLWCRLVAIPPIGPLAWEPPYAVGVAQEIAKKKDKKKKKLTCLVTVHLFPHFHRPFQPPPQVLCTCGPLSGCSASPRSFSWCLLTLPSSVQRCFLLVEAVPSDHGRTLPFVPEVYSEHLLLSPSWG